MCVSISPYMVSSLHLVEVGLNRRSTVHPYAVIQQKGGVGNNAPGVLHVVLFSSFPTAV